MVKMCKKGENKVFLNFLPCKLHPSSFSLHNYSPTSALCASMVGTQLAGFPTVPLLWVSTPFHMGLQAWDLVLGFQISHSAEPGRMKAAGSHQGFTLAQLTLSPIAFRWVKINPSLFSVSTTITDVGCPAGLMVALYLSQDRGSYKPNTAAIPAFPFKKLSLEISELCMEMKVIKTRRAVVKRACPSFPALSVSLYYISQKASHLLDSVSLSKVCNRWRRWSYSSFGTSAEGRTQPRQRAVLPSELIQGSCMDNYGMLLLEDKHLGR